MKKLIRYVGFTLLEVLVALSILAVAMAAAIRTGGASTQAAFELRSRTLAVWVAENHIATLRSTRQWPDSGESRGETDMGKEHFYWRQKVSSTPNPLFRRIDFEVGRTPPNEGNRLARLVTVLVRPR